MWFLGVENEATRLTEVEYPLRTGDIDTCSLLELQLLRSCVEMEGLRLPMSTSGMVSRERGYSYESIFILD
jgi:hypothetical protein